MADIAFYLAAASAVSILFSIAVSQILLALGVVALLLSGVRVRFPPILLPLGLFMAGTLISLLLSADPAGGRPQVRKFFVFLIVMVVYSTARSLARVRGILLVSTAIVSFSALWSFVQFVDKWRQARALGRPFYAYYTSERITGFMSHWMTLGGQEMIVVLMAAALLFFSFERRWKPWLVPAVGVILGSLGDQLYAQHLAGDACRRPLPAVAVAALVGAHDTGSSRAADCGESNRFARAGPLCIPAARGHGLQRVPACLPQDRHRDDQSAPLVRARSRAGEGSIFALRSCRCAEAATLGMVRPSPRHLPPLRAERGIPAMLALMWLLGKMLYDFIRHVRLASGDARAILHGAIAVIVAMLLVGYFELNLGDTEVLTVFLVTAACAYVAVDAIKDGHDRREFLAFIAGGAVGRSAGRPLSKRSEVRCRRRSSGRSSYMSTSWWTLSGRTRSVPAATTPVKCSAQRFPNSRL